MLEFLNDMDNYEARKIAKDRTASGIMVSTAYTSDEGFETALRPKVGVWVPVERYPGRAEAVKGHDKWVGFAKTGRGKTVIRLSGLGGTVPEKQVLL